MKRCRVGDIAMVRRGDRFGWVVEIIAEPQPCDFTLPNGVKACGSDPSKSWVVRSLSGQFMEAHGDKLYGVGGDAALMPIGRNKAKEKEKDSEVTA
jgi:hypothetical protein